MIPKIKPLPEWVLTDLQPAFYDTEAVTVLELLSKIYGKINELVNDYNEFVTEIDAKVDDQDAKIDAAVKYLKDNLIETVTDLFNEALEAGTLTSEFSISYDSATETLTLQDTLTNSES